MPAFCECRRNDVAFEIRSPSDGCFVVDEIGKSGGWVAQKRFDTMEQAQMHLTSRQDDTRALKGMSLD